MSTTTLSIPADEVAIAEVSSDWSPDELRERIAQEQELRSIIGDYYHSQMIENKHYYILQAGQKPVLSKEGALNLCSLFKVRVTPDEPLESYQEDGHYSVRYRVHLLSTRTEESVAHGDGFCSTQESKYAYSSGASQVPTPNPVDHYNTVLKMGYKRAIVAAVLCLPLMSELFTQDLEDFSMPRQSLPAPSGNERQSARTQWKRGQSSTTQKAEPPTATAPDSQSVAPEQLKHLFDRIDECHVDRETFREYLKQMGLQGTKELNPAQVQQCFSELDTRKNQAFQPQDVPDPEEEAEPETEPDEQGTRLKLFEALKSLHAELAQAEQTQAPGEPHADTFMELAQWLVRVAKACEHEDTPDDQLNNYLVEVCQARDELDCLTMQAVA